MNLNLTYKEIIDHLDRYSTDPMVHRLLGMILEKEETIIEGLLEVGMDEDGRIEGNDGWYLPGPYINHLRTELDYYEGEAREWEEKYADMKDERDRLKARSVADLLSEMREQVRRAESARDEASRRAQNYKTENEELTEKINVWSILEK